MTDRSSSDATDDLQARVGEPAHYGQHHRSALKALTRGSEKRAKRTGCVVSLLVSAVVLLALGLPAYFLVPLVMDQVTKSRLRETGVSAPAEILSVRETNSWINEERVIALSLRVAPDDGAPYTTKVEQAFSMLHGGNLHQGAGVTVKYDPTDPGVVVITETGVLPPRAGSPQADSPAPETDPSQSHDQKTQLSGAQRAMPKGSTGDRENGKHNSGTSAAPQNATDPVCQRTARCCLVASNNPVQAGCETFLTTPVTPAACASALLSYQSIAEKAGKTCN